MENSVDTVVSKMITSNVEQYLLVFAKMEMVHTFVFISAVILNPIECSSSSALNPHSRNIRGPPPSAHVADKQHSPDQRRPEEAPARVRSRSPNISTLLLERLGYSLEELGYMRLIPSINESLKFEFRRCIFPRSMPIRLRAEQNKRVPMPVREQIVLSLSNGDIFAKLDHNGILRGIYGTDKGYSRIKINMMSGAIDKMTPGEMKVCPLGENFPMFPYTFIRSSANETSLRSMWNVHSEHEETHLRAEHSSALGRPPTDQILGLSLEQLGYVRLVPVENRNRHFEFRKYVIPANKSIRFQLEGTYIPVPNREHIVLSTSDGDVFAILEYTGILRAIYSSNANRARVKMNMISGAVDRMTASEQKECHVGTKYPIFPRWFSKVVVGEDSLQHVYQ